MSLHGTFAKPNITLRDLRDTICPSTGLLQKLFYLVLCLKQYLVICLSSFNYIYSYTFVIVISRSVSPESVHRFPFAEGIRHTLSYESVSLLVNVSPVFLTVYR